jgi:16S rRNA processing protein RimM
MSSTEPVKVGKILDAHALKGEVYLFSFSKDISWLDTEIELVLESDKIGGQKNFTVKQFRPFKDGALIKFEGIDNRNQSEELKGSIVFVADEELVSESGETIYLREVLNFEVVDEQGKSLGKVTSFSSNGNQDLLVINTGSFSYEVPFVDDFIIEIQFEKSTIVMDFPLDLMDINRVI